MRKGTEIETDAELPRDEKTDRDLEAEISIVFAGRDESACWTQGSLQGGTSWGTGVIHRLRSPSFT